MSETRALLLTDVVDSTRLSEQLGDAAMAALWATHDRVARDLLSAHRGREIDKTDGFLLLFETAADGVAYAVAYHAALRALEPPIQARAGLHVGPVILTENSLADVARGAKPLEVDGLAKPTAARVMSVAVGGQTLVTAEARGELGKTPLRTESHGHWRMKGVSEPIELFEVGDASAPFLPPPDGAKVYRVVQRDGMWLPVRQVKHSLPTERDAFVGRHADLQLLADRLDGGAHLVSVLGIGGTGKTRLVTRYGWTWLGDYPGGVWFCDLSEARGLDGIVHAVARALDVPLGEDDPVVQLGHAIAGRGPCLLILDNFEQVARHAAETVGRWLDRANLAQFVVTTREVLGLPGETALPLAPLVQTEAIDLFVARAIQSKPDFVLTDADRPHVEALVKLLDQLPLAIELAAARSRLMAPKTLLARMSQRFKLLASSGGRHTRQATLQAALDWSWELLSADEQAALAQLSVFEGGFTLDACEGVLELAEDWPMDAVQALIDKSLVRPAGSGSAATERLDLLVSVQEYAAQKLDAIGDRTATEARHGAWFAALDTQIDPVLARRELDNRMVACRRAVSRGDAATAVATLEGAWDGLALAGPFSVGAELAGMVAGMAGLGPAEVARVDCVCGRALTLAGRFDEAGAHFDVALEAARAASDTRLVGLVRLGQGVRFGSQNRWDEADPLLEEAITSLRRCGDRRSEAVALSGSAGSRVFTFRWDEASDILRLALAAHRALGDRQHEGLALMRLGLVSNRQGLHEQARTHLLEALAATREVGDRRHEGMTLLNLATVYGQLHRSDEARATLEAAVSVSREIGDRWLEAASLMNLAGLPGGEDASNRQHFEHALALARERGDLRAEVTVLGSLGNYHRKCGRLDEAKAHFEGALVLAQDRGDVIWQLQSRLLLALVSREAGQAEESFAWLDGTLQVARESGDSRFLAGALDGLGRTHQLLGQLDEAEVHFQRARVVSQDAGMPEFGLNALEHLAEVWIIQGRLQDGRNLLDEALSVTRERGDSPGEGPLLGILAVIEARQGDFAAARAAAGRAEGMLRAPGNEERLGALLARRAEVEHLAGDPVAARAALDEATAIAASLHKLPGSPLGRQINQVRALLDGGGA